MVMMKWKGFIANKNRYHKPQLSLNHLWKLIISQAYPLLYMSLGDGGGYRFRVKIKIIYIV